MAFFPTYKSQFTRTPNVFYDEILKTKNISANDIKLVGGLIRNTLGYNKDAKWVGVSRKDLEDNFGIGKSNITKTLERCVENGWIITYETGKGTKKQRYIFLNDDRNVRIVEGLKAEAFSIDDLQYLNEAGIEKLLTDNGLGEEKKKQEESSCPESGQENKCSYPESGQVAYPESGQAAYPESGQADKAQSHAVQEVADALNTTIFKDKSFKYIFVVVEDILSTWEKSFSEKLAPKKVIPLLKDAKGDHEIVIREIKNVADDPEAKSPIACVRHGIKNGGWDPKPKRKPSRQKRRQPDKPSPNRSGKQNNDDLPRAVAQAIEREAKGEKVSGGEVDPIVEARLRAKLDRMRQRLSQRQKEITS